MGFNLPRHDVMVCFREWLLVLCVGDGLGRDIGVRGALVGFGGLM